MLTARQIVNAARDRAASFDGKRHPDAAALRYLSAVQRDLHSKVLFLDPTLFQEEETYTLPLDDFDEGIQLPEHRSVEGVVVRGPASGSSPGRAARVELLPWGLRDAGGTSRLAAWVVGQRLYLRSPASLWDGGSEIAIATTAIPAELTTLDDELILPDTAELALTEALALFFARRDSQSGLNISLYQIAAKDAEDSFLRDIANRLAGTSFRIRDTWL